MMNCYSVEDIAVGVCLCVISTVASFLFTWGSLADGASFIILWSIFESSSPSIFESSTLSVFNLSDCGGLCNATGNSGVGNSTSCRDMDNYTLANLHVSSSRRDELRRIPSFMILAIIISARTAVTAPLLFWKVLRSNTDNKSKANENQHDDHGVMNEKPPDKTGGSATPAATSINAVVDIAINPSHSHSQTFAVLAQQRRPNGDTNDPMTPSKCAPNHMFGTTQEPAQLDEFPRGNEQKARITPEASQSPPRNSQIPPIFCGKTSQKESDQKITTGDENKEHVSSTFKHPSSPSISPSASPSHLSASHHGVGFFASNIPFSLMVFSIVTCSGFAGTLLVVGVLRLIFAQLHTNSEDADEDFQEQINKVGNICAIFLFVSTIFWIGLRRIKIALVQITSDRPFDDSPPSSICAPELPLWINKLLRPSFLKRIRYRYCSGNESHLSGYELKSIASGHELNVHDAKVKSSTTTAAVTTPSPSPAASSSDVLLKGFLSEMDTSIPILAEAKAMLSVTFFFVGALTTAVGFGSPPLLIMMLLYGPSIPTSYVLYTLPAASACIALFRFALFLLLGIVPSHYWPFVVVVGVSSLISTYIASSMPVEVSRKGLLVETLQKQAPVYTFLCGVILLARDNRFFVFLSVLFFIAVTLYQLYSTWVKDEVTSFDTIFCGAESERPSTSGATASTSHSTANFALDRSRIACGSADPFVDFVFPLWVLRKSGKEAIQSTSVTQSSAYKINTVNNAVKANEETVPQPRALNQPSVTLIPMVGKERDHQKNQSKFEAEQHLILSGEALRAKLAAQRIQREQELLRLQREIST